MTKLAELKAQLALQPEFADAYDQATEAFAAIEAMVRARLESGLSQAEIAARMGTTQSAISRLEGGKVSPTLETLQRYARAAGKRLRLELR